MPFVRYKTFGRSLYRIIIIHAFVDRQTDGNLVLIPPCIVCSVVKCHRHVSFGSTYALYILWKHIVLQLILRICMGVARIFAVGGGAGGSWCTHKRGVIFRYGMV